MKRNLEHLNKRHLKRIEQWLACKDPKTTCPFEGMIRENGSVCKAMFPKLEKQSSYLWYLCIVPCPCTKYKLTYIKQVAKQVLKERETIKKS